jgi:hypothetical protein
LAEERGVFRIEAAGQKIERNVARAFTQRFRIADAGKRVVFGNEIKGFALGLQRNRRPHHAEIIADVQRATGLDAG